MFLFELWITCALLNVDGLHSSVHYLCKGLIIVTVPIVMDLKEEWKCTGNSMENMHTDVRGNFLLCILHDTNNFDPSKYTKSKKEPFFFQIHHNDEDGFSSFI